MHYTAEQLAEQLAAGTFNLKDVSRGISDAVAQISAEHLMPYFRGEKENLIFAKMDADLVSRAASTADIEMDEEIRKVLEAEFEGVPIVSEEGEKTLPKGCNTYFLMDSCDGTIELISGSSNFSVNVALVHNGRPVLGLLHFPTDNKTYYGYKFKGQRGAYEVDHVHSKERTISVRRQSDFENGVPKVVVGEAAGDREHANEVQKLYATKSNAALVPIARAFVAVAKGEADIYSHFGLPNFIWDDAAGVALVEGAGGAIVTQNPGHKIYFGMPMIRQENFYACGAPEIVQQQVLHRQSSKLGHLKQ